MPTSPAVAVKAQTRESVSDSFLDVLPISPNLAGRHRASQTFRLCSEPPRRTPDGTAPTTLGSTFHECRPCLPEGWTRHQPGPLFLTVLTESISSHKLSSFPSESSELLDGDTGVRSQVGQLH